MNPFIEYIHVRHRLEIELVTNFRRRCADSNQSTLAAKDVSDVTEIGNFPIFSDATYSETIYSNMKSLTKYSSPYSRKMLSEEIINLTKIIYIRMNIFLPI